MSVFDLERSVTLGYSCELCLFIKRLCHSHNTEMGEIWHSCFIWRGPSLRRFPVTSRENPFDVKVRSKPTDRVFSYERPGFQLQWKGEIATAEVKKEKSQLGSLSDSLLLQVRLYSECLFPTFEGRGTTPAIFAHTALACSGYTPLSLTFLLTASYLPSDTNEVWFT